MKKIYLVLLILPLIGLGQDGLECNYNCKKKDANNKIRHHKDCDINKNATIDCAAVSCDSIIKYSDYLCKFHSQLIIDGKGNFKVSRQWWE